MASILLAKDRKTDNGVYLIFETYFVSLLNKDILEYNIKSTTVILIHDFMMSN